MNLVDKILFAASGPSRSEDIRFRVFSKGGRPRWIIEDRYNYPWHLKTWPRSSPFARIIYKASVVLSRLGIQLPHKKWDVSCDNLSVYGKIRAEWDNIGVFLGTPGPNRKIVVYAGRADRSVFIKIPLNKGSAALVARETEALEELAKDPDIAPFVPRVDEVAGHLAVENIEATGVRHAAIGMFEVARIHELLERRSATIIPLHVLHNEWQREHEGKTFDHESGISELLKSTRAIAHEFLDSFPRDLAVPCYMAHGDFTRWNVLRAVDGTARIIDWEFYGLKPRWFDVVHYVVSYDLLIARLSGDKVIEHLSTVGRDIGVVTRGKGWWQHVGLYFAYQSLYYSAVYARQPTLHIQAVWQLKAWKEILHSLFDICDGDAS